MANIKLKTKTLYILVWSFCFIFILYRPLQAADESLEQLLVAAEEVRSTDSYLFNQILDKIKARESQLTPNQKELYQYLDSYSMAYQGQFEGAIEGLQSIINTSSDNELVFRSRMSLVNVYAITRDHLEGIKNLQFLVSEYTKVETDDTRHQGLIMAALSYNAYKRFNLAIEYADKVLSENPNSRNLCFINQVRFESLQELGRFTPESAEVLNAIKQCTELNENIPVLLIRILVAREYLKKSESQKTIDYLIKYEQAAKQTNYPRLIAEYYILFARAKWQVTQTLDAEKYANRAIDISEGEDFVKPKVLAYALLYEIAKARGNFKMALEHYENYTEKDKAQINEIMAQQLAYNIAEHQTEEKIQEIKLLNEQNKVLELEQDLSQKEASNNRLMVALLVLGLTFLAFWAYRVKRNQVKLKREAEIDQLTGVFTRRHFYAMTHRQIDYCHDMGLDISFIIFDMDSFKSINDTYGHLVGDWVLQKTIEVCRPFWQSKDIIGRLGGEEFAIVLPGCDINKAQEVAEQCRKTMFETDTFESGHEIQISASFGVTSNKYSDYDFKQLLSDADQVMYEAKNSGKNAVHLINESARASVV